LKKLCEKTGKLLKGGEPDFNNCSRSVIVDFQRGNLPYFERPPKTEEEEQLENERIEKMDPAVKNPLEEVGEEQNLTTA
jgi:nuclear GTP-binding protein